MAKTEIKKEIHTVLVKMSIGLRRLLKERKYPGGQELPLYLLWEASSREKGIG